MDVVFIAGIVLLLILCERLATACEKLGGRL